MSLIFTLTLWPIIVLTALEALVNLYHQEIEKIEILWWTAENENVRIQNYVVRQFHLKNEFSKC